MTDSAGTEMAEDSLPKWPRTHGRNGRNGRVHVLVSLAPVRPDRVKLVLGFLHPAVAGLVTALVPGIAAATVVDHALRSRVRHLMQALCAARGAQRTVDAQARRRPLPAHRCVLPVTLLDADTLFMGCLLGQAWVESRRLPCADQGRCQRCNGDAWGLSCTPPRWGRGGGVCRDHLDALTAFCWTCLARRDLILARRAVSWPAGTFAETFAGT